MQKNPGQNLTPIEVDPVTGEYCIKLPEWILNDFGWYEGTTINLSVEGDCIIINEVDFD